MDSKCPHCSSPKYDSGGRKLIYGNGEARRKSDGRWLSKFHCQACGRSFSNATFAKEYRQKKRHKNSQIRKLLAERASLRGIARLLNLSRTTVHRKLKWLGEHAQLELVAMNGKLTMHSGPARHIQFDDLETAEGSKYLPLHLTKVVAHKSRWIFGSVVSSVPTKIALKGAKLTKYGGRKDERAAGRQKLFISIAPFVHSRATIESDSHPQYSKSIKEHFPKARHVQYASRKPRPHGQDELKKGHDPLFSINHTFAMHRCRVSRLARKSWCLSKKAEPLRWHLAIYAVEHNKRLAIWKQLNKNN